VLVQEIDDHPPALLIQHAIGVTHLSSLCNLLFTAFAYVLQAL
jgi:hypothetical protein